MQGERPCPQLIAHQKTMTTHKEVMPGVFSQRTFTLTRNTRKSLKKQALRLVKDPVFQAAILGIVICAGIMVSAMKISANYY